MGCILHKKMYRKVRYIFETCLQILVFQVRILACTWLWLIKINLREVFFRLGNNINSSLLKYRFYPINNNILKNNAEERVPYEHNTSTIHYHLLTRHTVNQPIVRGERGKWSDKKANLPFCWLPAIATYSYVHVLHNFSKFYLISHLLNNNGPALVWEFWHKHS
jgi:hypothetical protein